MLSATARFLRMMLLRVYLQNFEGFGALRCNFNSFIAKQNKYVFSYIFFVVAGSRILQFLHRKILTFLFSAISEYHRHFLNNFRFNH